MPSSTALVYRQYQTLDNSGSGPGTQWLRALWEVYQWLFADCEAADSGRWSLLGSSPAAPSWSAAANIVDNSWFALECSLGRHQWQAKFQATNVAALDEAPGLTYCLAVSLSPAGGWVAKGGANGGFSGTTIPAGTHLLLGGSDISGADGRVTIHGDRDTVLIAIATSGSTDYDAGGYLGRFEPFVDEIPYPECLLTAWDGVGSPKGFDRTALGGVFGAAPGGSYALDSAVPPVADTCQVWTPGWLTSARQPNPFSGQFHWRPLELSISTSPLGYLRHVDSAAGLISGSRIDYRRKLVLHNANADVAVAIKHNGTQPT